MSVTFAPVPTLSPEAIRTREFFDALLPPPRNFLVRLWDGTEFGGEEGATYTIVLSSPGAARRIFGLPVEVTLAEAFMSGDLEIEGDLFRAFGLKDSARAAVATVPQALSLLRLRQRLPRDGVQHAERRAARLSGRIGTRDRDRSAIQHHYDVGNAFYQLWLDRRMIYSCGYFPAGTEDLDTAQALKLEHICRKLDLREGERFLDIGCGWGGLCIYAAQRFGVEAVGVTLSQEQYKLARERVAAAGLEGRVDIRLLDYRDLTERFAKIASVGMFEHVPDHAEYFSHAYRLLEPRGLFLNHSIATVPDSDAWGKHSLGKRLLHRHVLGTGLIRDRYIFPDGQLVPVSQANLVAEQAGFEVRDVENLREHYAMTLRNWVSRLERRGEEAIQISGEFIFRAWRIYLTASAIEFDRGTISVNQTLLARPHRGDAGVPLSRAGLYSQTTG